MNYQTVAYKVLTPSEVNLIVALGFIVEQIDGSLYEVMVAA